MSYVDGFVIALPRKNLGTYKKMAEMGKRAWMKHGALAYYECAGDDLKAKKGMGVPFTRLAKTKPGETVIFAFILFKSRKHRDLVNRKVMSEMPGMGEMEMPFSMSRFSYGGFKTIVEASASQRRGQQKARPVAQAETRAEPASIH